MKKMAVARFTAVLTAALVAVAGFTVPTSVKAADSIEVTGTDSLRGTPTINLEQDYDVRFEEGSCIQYFQFTTSDREDSTYTIRHYYVNESLAESVNAANLSPTVVIMDENGNGVGNYLYAKNSGLPSSETIKLNPGTTYYVYMQLQYYDHSQFKLDSPSYVVSSFRITENISAKAKAEMERENNDESSDDENTGDDTNEESDTDVDDEDSDDEDEIDYDSLKDELSVAPIVIKGHKNNSKKIRVVTNEAVTKVTYSSANKNIAKVTKNGKVKLLKKGKTKITVKFYCGDGDVITSKVTVKVV